MSKLDLPHVFARAFNTPLLIADAKLEAILSGIGNRVIAGDVGASRDDRPEAEASAGQDRRFKSGGYLLDNGIAVLPIIGTMVRRGSWLDAESGLMSYAAIRRGIAEMANDGAVRGIMLEIDSYGGEAAGVFELADWIAEASSRSGKPIRAHVNESAASAAYAIASPAEFISIPMTGEAGSIGVVCAHVDVSEADKKAGHKWTFIHAGAKKVDGNAHQPLNNSAKSELQADIDFLYEMFVGMVSRNRGIDAASVKATEAGIYRGELAVQAGLADAVMTFDEAIAAFAGRLDLQDANPDYVMTKGATMPKKPNDGKPNAEADNVETPEVETPEVEDAAEDEAPAAPEASAPGPIGSLVATTDAVAAERARVSELAKIEKQAEKVGVTFDLQAAIAGGIAPEAARAQVLNAAAEAPAPGATANVIARPHMATSPERASGEEIAAGWDKAIDAVKANRGLK